MSVFQFQLLNYHALNIITKADVAYRINNGDFLLNRAARVGRGDRQSDDSSAELRFIDFHTGDVLRFIVIVELF